MCICYYLVHLYPLFTPTEHTTQYTQSLTKFRLHGIWPVIVPDRIAVLPTVCSETEETENQKLCVVQPLRNQYTKDNNGEHTSVRSRLSVSSLSAVANSSRLSVWICDRRFANCPSSSAARSVAR